MIFPCGGQPEAGEILCSETESWDYPPAMEAKFASLREKPMNRRLVLLAAGLVTCLSMSPAIRAEDAKVSGEPKAPGQHEAYQLGPEDTVFIRVLNVDELGNQTDAFRIDLDGDVDVPRIGRTHAAGLTMEQFEAVLVDRFRTYLQNPVVTVRVAEFHSKRVSVLGAVSIPGVHTLQGDKTLLEVISEAGGLSKDAGSVVEIARRKEEGAIPLATAAPDKTGAYSVAQVNIDQIISAKDPQDNILIRPDDVITVPHAELVYVIGSVKQAGGFTLSEHRNLSVLQALSLANGLDNTAAPAKARVLRLVAGSDNRTEIPVNLKKILAGKGGDVPLVPNDILFIPNNSAKSASLKVVQAMIQVGTGIAIYGPRY
jgi:polysaccharide biosynthesis/export protein